MSWVNSLTVVLEEDSMTCGERPRLSPRERMKRARRQAGQMYLFSVEQR